MSLFPITASNPFAYREAPTDSHLDILDEAARVNSAYSLSRGFISEEQAENNARLRDSNREIYKRCDHRLEAAVRGMYMSPDSEFDDAPLTPPRSPRPDQTIEENLLSEKEWRIDVTLMKTRGCYDPEDFGFNSYETWKQYQIKHRQPQSQPPEHESMAQNGIQNPPLPECSTSRTVSTYESDFHEKNSRSKMTRARARQCLTSPFYELAEDGKTLREIRPVRPMREKHHKSAPKRSSHCIHKPYRSSHSL